MKRNTILVALILVTMILSGQNNGKVEISGRLEGIQGGSGSLLVGNNRIPVEIKDGRFSLVTEVADTEVARLMIDDKRLFKTVTGSGYIPVKSMNIWLVIYPGAKINVKGTISDFADAYSYDGGENDILSGLHRELFPLLNKSANIEVEIQKNTSDKDKTGLLRKEQENIDNKAQELRLGFLNKHASSIAGLWLMEDMIIRSQISMEDIEKLLPGVAPEYRTCSYYTSVYSRLKGYQTTRVGMIAPEISSRATPDSSLFNLSGLRGKYVIIDFWGTWCGACIQGIPKMKEFRDRHADKLQIAGIAQDRDFNRWKSFIEQRGMNWPNVFSGKGKEDFILMYNVQGFPTKILLGPDGKILYRSVGEDDNFYTEVEKLMHIR